MSHAELIRHPGLPALVITPQPHASSISVVLLVRAGSRDDPPHREGMAHLVEHMVFQGTRRRPAPHQVVAALDRVGGELNAETDRECTSYYVQLPPAHLELAVDSLADLVEAPLFLEQALTKEKRVVREEIAQFLDTPEDFVQELLRRGLWGEHPLAHCELGDEDSVARIKTRHLRQFLADHYRPEQMVLSVAGATTPEAVLAAARQVPWPAAGGSAPPPRPVPTVPPGQQLQENEDTEETHLALAFPALPLGDPDVPALILLNAMLGGCMTSRLFQEVREKRGLAYDVDSELDLLSDGGLWSVSTGVRPERAAEALRVIGHQLGLLAQGRFEQEELDHARGHSLGTSLLWFEHHRNLADWQARHLLLQGQLGDAARRQRELEAVDLAQAREVAQRLLDPARLVLAVVGPDDDLPALHRALLGCW